MAGRKIKRCLDNFPIQTDFFQDLKIRKLVKYQGGKAVSVYLALLCMIYREGYYLERDNELPFIISSLLGYEEAYVREAIQCCVALGLFDAEMLRVNDVYTSTSIQRRYQHICTSGRRQAGVTEYSLLDGLDENIRQRVAEMKESPLWIVQMERKHEVTKEQLPALIDEWALQVAPEEREVLNTAAAKRQFSAWLAKQIKKKTTTEKKKQNGKPTNTTRPSLQVSRDPQDYKAAL